MKETIYKKAVSLADSGRYDEAILIFDSLTDYRDSKDLTAKVSADKLYDSGDLAGAYDVYAELSEAYQTHSADYQAAYAAAEEKLEEHAFDEASSQFAALGNYSDAGERAVECIYAKAEYLLQSGKYTEAAEVYKSLSEFEKANDALYQNAAHLRTNDDFIGAAEQYSALLDYSDSREQWYQTGLQAWSAGKDLDAVTIFSMDKEYSESLETIYQIGKKASAEQRYDVSTTAFTSAGTYKDAAMNLSRDMYAWGGQLFDNGDYEEAIRVFESMGDFSDAPERRKEAKYALAMETFEKGDYPAANQLFRSIDGYSNSSEMATECEYQSAKLLYDSGEYEKALQAFTDAGLKEYKDTSVLMDSSYYQLGLKEIQEGNYAKAAEWFDQAGVYSDSKEKAKECRYQIALTVKSEGRYEEAAGLFGELEEYSDSSTQILECYQTYGDVLMEDKDYESAYEKYEAAQNTEKMEEAAYQAALEKLTKSQYEDAISWFIKAGEYSDSREQILSIAEYYYSTKQYELAEAAFVKVVETGNADQRLYEIGQIYEQSGEEEKAHIAYHESGEYAFERVYKPFYDEGINLRDQKKWGEAKESFKKAKDYSDAETQIPETDYLHAKYLAETGAYDEAVALFTELGDYSDAKTQIKQTKYMHAEALETVGDQEGAYEIFISLGDYSDSFERAVKPYYDLGLAEIEKKEWTEAIEAFRKTGEYLDSAGKINESYYNLAEEDLEDDRFVDALLHYRKAGTYNDALAKAIVLECKFCSLFSKSEDVLSALKADGTLETEQRSDSRRVDRHKNPYMTDLVKIHRNTLGAVGLNSEGKLELYGDYTILKEALDWENIADMQIDVLNIVALKSNGKIMVAEEYNENWDPVKKWSNIKKIAMTFGEYLIGLDTDGHTYGYDPFTEIERKFEGEIDDITLTTDGTVFALAKDGSVLRLMREWVPYYDSSWEDLLLSNQRISGVQSDTNELARLKYPDGSTLVLFSDGTINSNSFDAANDWKLWNDQKELADIFNWNPADIPPIDY